jgi:hypothetical protein
MASAVNVSHKVRQIRTAANSALASQGGEPDAARNAMALIKQLAEAVEELVSVVEELERQRR